MAKVAAIIADMFEDSEFSAPAEAFAKAGHEVVTVGIKAGVTVKGKKEGLEVYVLKAVAGENASDYDALLIPGGYSPDKLRRYKEAVEFTRDFFLYDKPVFIICHSVQLLVTCDVLKGRKLTCLPGIAQDALNAGGMFFDREVVVDGALVSSRTPDDLPAFIRESLKKLG
jgi:protease I